MEMIQTRITDVFNITPQRSLSETLFEIDNKISQIKKSKEIKLVIDKTYKAGWIQGSKYLSADEIDFIKQKSYENFFGVGLEVIAHDVRSQLFDELQDAYNTNSSKNIIKKIIDNQLKKNEYRVVRMGRTAANDVFNLATLDRYKKHEIEYVRYKAKLDSKTTEICSTLHGTIWKTGDPEIKTPPSHFYCRSRLVPWTGRPPEGEREFTKNQEQVLKDRDKFRTKYWNI